jgi:hypothetical protein
MTLEADRDFQKIIIRSEADAWKWLETATSHPEEIPCPVLLQFDEWPVFHMHIEGKDWNSSVPSRVMSPLLEVQRDIHRAYTRALYNKESTHNLTDEAREQLEIILRVKPGSSVYDADLWKQLTEIARAMVDKMEPAHIVLTVLSCALIWGATAYGKKRLKNRTEEKRLETKEKIHLAQEETERLKVLAMAGQQLPAIKAQMRDFDATQNRLLKAVRPTDTVYLDNIKLSGAEAAEIVHAEHENSTETVLDGLYRVLANDTTRNPGGFRIKVARLSDGLTFQADVPLELDSDQKKLIQQAEWSRSAQVVNMTIRTEILRGRISDAVVISASSVEDATQAATDKDSF